MAERLTKINAAQGPAATMLERHRAIFHESGVQRIWGPQALLRRLGLMEKNTKGTMATLRQHAVVAFAQISCTL